MHMCVCVFVSGKIEKKKDWGNERANEKTELVMKWNRWEERWKIIWQFSYINSIDKSRLSKKEEKEEEDEKQHEKMV